MSSLSHDPSVTVQSFEDHLGFPLNVFDEVKLEDVIIAWCTHTGALIYYLRHYVDTMRTQLKLGKSIEYIFHFCMHCIISRH